MKRSGILILSVMLSASSIAQDSSPRLVMTSVSGGTALVAATAAAAASGPWSLLITLVGQFLSAFKGGKSDNKVAQNAVKNASGLDQQVAYLQAWPNLLSDSDDFRRTAIELAQECNFLYYSPSDISEDQWSDVTTGISSAQQKYNGIYNNQTYIAILRNATEYNRTSTNVQYAWNVASGVMKHQNKTSAQRKATLQQLLPQMDAITQSAMLPEYWAIEEAKSLASQYQNVANQAKTAQGKNTSQENAKQQPAKGVSEKRRSSAIMPQLLSIAFSSTTPRVLQVQAIPGNQRKSEDANGADLAEAARANNMPPKWMTTSLNETRREYRANWYETLGGGLVGALAGFVCMLLLPAIFRATVTPRYAREMNLLQQSLSYRSDERNILAEQLGSLHLDVLNYVWKGPDEKISPQVSKPSMTSEQKVPKPLTPNEQRLQRIQRLRDMLKG